MNDLYLRLGRTIARICPTGFAQAKLEAVFGEARPALKIVATMPDGMEYQPGISGAERDELEPALDAVRSAMAAEDDRAWRGCTVTLVAGGGFSLDIDYRPERRDGLQILTH